VPVANATPTDQQGFAPDSVYAEWGPAEREASDRIEADGNMRRAAVLARRDEASGHTVDGYTDDMLRSAAKRYRRELEDIAEGDHHLPPKGPRGVNARVRFLEAALADIQSGQAYRAALAESWHAAEDGTHCYTGFVARGGLSAVIHNSAVPPSYELARLLDWERFKKGLPSVFVWDGGSQ